MRAILLLVFGWAVSPGTAAPNYRNLAGNGKECGLTNGDKGPKPSAYIMGGTAANIIDFPYAVSFQNNSNGDQHFCAGSLVHNKYVVTAAHCMFDCTGKGSYRSCSEKSYDDITLVAGEQNTVVANAAHEQKLYIEEVTIHENYNSGKVANHNSLNNGLYDIAVIKLKEAVEWTDWVKPVCLPGTRKLNLTEGASGYIAGWGMDGYDGDYNEEMQSITIPILDNRRCEDKLSHTDLDLDDNRFCAGHEVNGIDACWGDSGSGLITINKNSGHQRQILSGIMSKGEKCGEAKKPGIYTNVQNFAKWIEKIVKGQLP